MRLCAAAGITGPDGKPPSEALLLGLGGGLGAASFAFEYQGHTPTFYVATRCQPQYAYDTAFVERAATRLGARCDVAQSSSPAAAAKKLAARLATGPQMAWLDFGSLPWARRLGPVAEMGAMPHVVVIERIAGDVATVHDTPATPFTLDLATLAKARARLRNGKSRLLSVAPGDTPDPRDAIRAALADCAAELRGRKFGEDYRLTADGGGTRFDWTMGAEPAGIGKLLAPGLRVFMRRTLKRAARNLDRQLSRS
jgi:hypothetical protein